MFKNYVVFCSLKSEKHGRNNGETKKQHKICKIKKREKCKNTTRGSHRTQAGFHESTDISFDQANNYGIIVMASETCSIILKTFSSDAIDVGGHRQMPAWNIILRKLDVQSQMKLSQQNQQLEDLVRENAEYELQKFRRNIKANKYM